MIVSHAYLSGPFHNLQGMLAAVYWRIPASYQAARTFVLVEVLLLAAALAWMWCCRGAPNGGSHARWREAIPLILLLNNLMLGCHSGLVKAWLETMNPNSNGDGAAGLLCTLRHLLIVLVASRGLSQLMVSSQPLRIR